MPLLMLVVGLATLVPAAPVRAAEAAPPEVEEPLPEVEVAVERPGPGLWKIRRGANTVYVLGARNGQVTPLAYR